MHYEKPVLFRTELLLHIAFLLVSSSDLLPLAFCILIVQHRPKRPWYIDLFLKRFDNGNNEQDFFCNIVGGNPRLDRKKWTEQFLSRWIYQRYQIYPVQSLMTRLSFFELRCDRKLPRDIVSHDQQKNPLHQSDRFVSRKYRPIQNNWWAVDQKQSEQIQDGRLFQSRLPRM